MLDAKRIRQNPKEIDALLRTRNTAISLDHFLALDEKRRKLLALAEEKKALRNNTSREIGLAKKRKAPPSELDAITERVRLIGEEIAAFDQEISIVDQELTAILASLPNLPCSSVPVGNCEQDNSVVRTTGEVRRFLWEPKTYQELCEDLHLLSNGVFRGQCAQLLRALGNMLLDCCIEHGYQEALFNDEQHVASNSLLPASAQDVIFPAAQLPAKSCMLHSHKLEVETILISAPDEEPAAEESLFAPVETLFRALKLPYRIVLQCTGLQDFEAVRTCSIELWLPSKQRYIEAARCSLHGDYLARRFGIRWRDQSRDKPRLACTAKASIQLKAIVFALLETYQNEDGTVEIPEILVPLMKTNLIQYQP